ncbi:hypothetical protein C1H46_010710 [Malus baccata]|uniref:Uncharacterized protein n=1 Tax=Malus baccata TaxID=106549 RepID=A0A540MY64_MALBA|nr:hypothetical protein C1H46_010710 [Malus baccata]
MEWAMHIVEEVQQERNRNNLPEKKTIAQGVGNAHSRGSPARRNCNNLPEKVFCASVIPYWYKFKEDASAFDGLIQLGDDKEKNVTFVTYPETQAKSIVTNTSGLNHDAILRVWFATYCNTRNMWLVCYDRFDCYMRPWLN